MDRGFSNAKVGALALAMSLLPLVPGAVRAQQFAVLDQISTTDFVLNGIVGCIRDGKEAVLLQREIVCVPYFSGRNYFDTRKITSPFDQDPSAVCADLDDKRRLSSNVIKRLVARTEFDRLTTGIRIIGGVYCETLDLIGLELNYSLVLDRSVFKQGILGRSFRSKADLSVDGSSVFGAFRLNRARIDGTVFASEAFIENLQVVESEIKSSLLIHNSVLLGRAEVEKVLIAGELSLRHSTLSHLLIGFSRVGGVLDLSGSEVRCKYNIRTNDIGSIAAVNVGLGHVVKGDGADNVDKRFYSWRRILQMSGFFDRFGIASKVAASEPCSVGDTASRPEFLMLDNRVRSSVCIRDFNWLSATSEDVSSYFTLNDLHVGGSLLIDLGVKGRTRKDILENGPTAEMIGVDAHIWVFDFAPDRQRYRLIVDGLRFQNVFSGITQCQYQPAESFRAARFIAEERSSLRLPRVAEVKDWLGKNDRHRTQPFASFVDAYQRTGDDFSVKELKVARATQEFHNDYQRWLTQLNSRKSPVEAPAQAATAELPAPSAINVAWNGFILGLQWLLWRTADHGYRPHQAIWIVSAVLFGFGLYFWLVLRIVGFLPKGKQHVSPIGVLFLFDRLIPAYKIRDDHYAVKTFYKRARASSKRGKTVRYLWRDWAVVAANETERRRAEAMLDVLKIFGIVLAVFLAAAINALVLR